MIYAGMNTDVLRYMRDSGVKRAADLIHEESGTPFSQRQLWHVVICIYYTYMASQQGKLAQRHWRLANAHGRC